MPLFGMVFWWKLTWQVYWQLAFSILSIAVAVVLCWMHCGFTDSAVSNLFMVLLVHEGKEFYLIDS